MNKSSSLVAWFHIIHMTILLSYIRQTLLNCYEEIFSDEILLSVLVLCHASVNILSPTKLGQSGYGKKKEWKSAWINHKISTKYIIKQSNNY